jgi:hypothetical protein
VPNPPENLESVLPIEYTEKVADFLFWAALRPNANPKL